MASRSEHQEAPRGARKQGRREQLRMFALLLLAVIITLFAVFNTDQVKIHWIVTTGHAPLIIVIVIAVLFGIALDRIAVRRGKKRR